MSEARTVVSGSYVLYLPCPRTQGDLMLLAADGCYVDDRVTLDKGLPQQERGSHGHLHTHLAMRAAFVCTGPAIPEGLRLTEASQLDVAPTVAALLRLTLPGAKRPQLWRA